MRSGFLLDSDHHFEDTEVDTILDLDRVDLPHSFDPKESLPLDLDILLPVFLLPSTSVDLHTFLHSTLASPASEGKQLGSVNPTRTDNKICLFHLWADFWFGMLLLPLQSVGLEIFVVDRTVLERMV